MIASIEISDLEMLRGDPLLLVMAADALEDLLDGGGAAGWRYNECRYVQLYEFEGPDELVREVVTAMMTFKLDSAVERVDE